MKFTMQGQRCRQNGTLKTDLLSRLVSLTVPSVHFYRRQSGASLIETALLLPLLILILVGAVDYGRGYYAAIEVSSAAQAGAVYGTLNPADTTGMVAMAKLNAKDIDGLSATALYGCECVDGSSVVVSCATSLVCSVNAVKYVEVTTSANYTPMLPFPGIASSFGLKDKVRLRASN